MHAIVRHLFVLCSLLCSVLLMTACATYDTGQDTRNQGTSNHATLENSYWKLVELNGKPVAAFDNQQEAHIILRGGQPAALSGAGGCNRLMGSYTLQNNAITFGNIATTMMACANGMDTEQAFTRVLADKKYWSIKNDSLILCDPDGKTVARFVVVYLR